MRATSSGFRRSWRAKPTVPGRKPRHNRRSPASQNPAPWPVTFSAARSLRPSTHLAFLHPRCRAPSRSVRCANMAHDWREICFAANPFPRFKKRYKGKKPFGPCLALDARGVQSCYGALPRRGPIEEFLLPGPGGSTLQGGLRALGLLAAAPVRRLKRSANRKSPRASGKAARSGDTRPRPLFHQRRPAPVGARQIAARRMAGEAACAPPPQGLPSAPDRRTTRSMPRSIYAAVTPRRRRTFASRRLRALNDQPGYRREVVRRPSAPPARGQHSKAQGTHPMGKDRLQFPSTTARDVAVFVDGGAPISLP